MLQKWRPICTSAPTLTISTYNRYLYRNRVVTYGLESAHERRSSKFVIPSWVSPVSTMNNITDKKKVTGILWQNSADANSLLQRNLRLMSYTLFRLYGYWNCLQIIFKILERTMCFAAVINPMLIPKCLPIVHSTLHLCCPNCPCLRPKAAKSLYNICNSQVSCECILLLRKWHYCNVISSVTPRRRSKMCSSAYFIHKTHFFPT